MKESTRKIFKMHGWRIDRAIHNYIYFVFYKLYVRIFLVLGRFAVKAFGSIGALSSGFKFVFNRYHAKVLTLDDATKILSLKQDVIVPPGRTERVIPFPYANRIILQEPEFIAVMDCPCRMAREKPCEPINVCIAVGKTTANFWLEHCDQYHVRRIDQAEALRIVNDAHERGQITTAWFKVATGGRTGVICSCCSCCCGGMEAMRLAHGVKFGGNVNIMIPSGYAAQLDTDKCVGCGECADLCMFDAIRKRPRGKPIYDKSACMGCGLCVEKCKQEARELVLDSSKGLPLDIDMLQVEET